MWGTTKVKRAAATNPTTGQRCDGFHIEGMEATRPRMRHVLCINHGGRGTWGKTSRTILSTKQHHANISEPYDHFRLPEPTCRASRRMLWEGSRKQSCPKRHAHDGENHSMGGVDKQYCFGIASFIAKCSHDTVKKRSALVYPRKKSSNVSVGTRDYGKWKCTFEDLKLSRDAESHFRGLLFTAVALFLQKESKAENPVAGVPDCMCVSKTSHCYPHDRVATALHSQKKCRETVIRKEKKAATRPRYSIVTSIYYCTASNNEYLTSCT